MNIVQITGYYPPHLGGQENVAREISERLAKRNHKVEVFTSDIGCEHDKLKSSKNLKINYLKAWEFAHTPIIIDLSKKLFNLEKGQIIHLHAGQAFVPEIVMVISKLRKVRYILQLHIDASPSSYLGKILLTPYKKFILKMVLKNASRISVLTKEYKKLVIDKYQIDENKIKIIPNGVSNRFFTKKHRINEKDEFNLLFVGRLSMQKNPRRLIESIEKCKSKVILDIVGDGELKEDILNLVKERNLKNINFHGRKEGKDLIEFYKKADAFILTSNEEAFPLTILEAAASGLPLIASRVKGNESIVKGKGILVNPLNPENFAKEIDNLVRNKKLRKSLSKKSINLANKHKWENIIPQWERLYREILNENKQN